MQLINLLYTRYRQKCLGGLFVILAIMGMANVYVVLNVNLQSNDECLWIPKKLDSVSSVVLIEKTKIGGVAWQAGIRDGDRLVEINGVKIDSDYGAAIELNRVAEGSYAKYLIERNGRRFETSVYVKKLLSFPHLGFSLFALIWLFVGLTVIIAKPDGRVQRLFFQIGACLVLFLSVALLPYAFWKKIFSDWIYLGRPVEFGFTLISCFLPLLIVRLFWIFPIEFKFMRRSGVKRAFLLVPLLLLCAYYLLSLTGISHRPGVAEYFKTFYRSSSPTFAAFLVGFLSLLINCFRIKDRKDRIPILIILISYFLGIASVVYTRIIASAFIDSFFNTPAYFMPIILVALIPVSFGVSIFKYQLMDVSIVIKNAIIYGVATLGLAVIYFLTVYVLGQQFGSLFGSNYRNLIAAISFVLFALVFQSTKNKFQELLTRKFYPEQFAYQQIILNFSNEVAGIVGEDKILDSMQETFTKSLKLDRFGIALRTSPEFRMKKSFGFGGEDYVIPERPLKSFVKSRLKLANRVVIDSQDFALAFPSVSDRLVEDSIFTVVPMIIKSRIIGLLLLGLKHSGSQFAGQDLDLLCTAASQAGLALENARLYESEMQRLALEKELDNAHRIQNGLLPKSIPQIPGMELAGLMSSAMQVGGDYYDIIPVSASRFFIVVADVSGKGLSASLYMSKIQTMMRLCCKTGCSPREVLININKNIYDSLERKCFITVSLALVDAEKMELSFCRAGHLPLLVAGENSVTNYQPGGMGLGLDVTDLFAQSLEEMRLKLKSGEVYSFFSDGVVEAMNSRNELFGEKNTAKLIADNRERPVNEILDNLMSSLSEFRNGRPQNDDVTLVFMKVL